MTIHESPLQKLRRWAAPIGIAALAVAALMAVLVGLNVGGWRDRLLPKAVAPRIESLAVLPLENISGDKEQEYFADGMTDALIAELGQIGSLRVISRTSVMRFKGARPQGGLEEIARQLKVDALIEGSVLRSGDRVRVTAQLIGAVPERHLWARSYERDLRDVLTLQSEVARAIANEIKANLTPAVQARLARTHAVNPEAYEAYLRGRYFWNKRTGEGTKKGIEFFGHALEKDPAYALAYTGLADCYYLLADYSFLSPREAFPRGKAAATKALELDETSAEAHTSLAVIKSEYEWDWLGAEREFKRAIELNPNYATAHHWYSDYLGEMGRHEEAIAEIKRAQQLDPLSLIINTVAGVRFHWARRYDEAVEQLRKTLEMDPNFAVAHHWLGQVYEQMGQHESAIAEHQKAIRASGGSSQAVAALGHAYAAAGKRNEALRILADLNERRKTAYVSPYDIAVIHVALGEKDQAFEWLEKAYQERAAPIVVLKVDPRLDPLRSDPRFQGLLRRMNFPP
jgi:TolB-like protein